MSVRRFWAWKLTFEIRKFAGRNLGTVQESTFSNSVSIFKPISLKNRVQIFYFGFCDLNWCWWQYHREIVTRFTKSWWQFSDVNGRNSVTFGSWRHWIIKLIALLKSQICYQHKKLSPTCLYGLVEFWMTVMLVTSLCWWLYDGDWFEMLVAGSLCWRLFSLCWWFSPCNKSVTNISNLSPTQLVSNTRRRCKLHHVTHCHVEIILPGSYPNRFRLPALR